MILVDSALKRAEQDGRPIRVGVIGAGFLGRHCIFQIANRVPGMRLVAVASRTPARALAALAEIGRDDAREVSTLAALEDGIRRNIPVVTGDGDLLCRSEQVDVIVEVTGAIEFAARTFLSAFAHGKHVVSMNAELDALLGPLMKKKADEAGVIYTVGDGDQPGATLNLYRFVTTMGFTPLLCGNIKGMLDRYRTPETQAAFAAEWGQDPYKVTSYADGTKISFEQAITANATGMSVLKRGMTGIEHHGHVDALTGAYDIEALRACGGAVDYVVGAEPGPGVFVMAEHDDPLHHRMIEYGKLGKGPLYCFTVPFHLFHMELPISIARAALFGDAAVATKDGLRVEVVAIAKRDLKAGEVIDGIGGYMTYGECENVRICEAEGLLAMGLAEGCVLTADVAKDGAIKLSDVTFPEERLIDRLRAEQSAAFPLSVP